VSLYRTIVADPPWHYGRKFNGFSGGQFDGGQGHLNDLPYPTLSVQQIAALPVSALADDAAHLYLWTTQKYLWDAPAVVRAWGFHPGPLLTWAKEPMGRGLGDAFTPTTEFVLFAHRGGLRPVQRHDSTWFAGKRAKHSVKPEAFLDIVEQVSPGPYVELFARRDRLGWDTWGNESLGTAVMPERQERAA
jgi:N6-adenosine-specific RNA methylase IME4